jgi:predicted metal-dependent hydrolase
MWVTPAGYGRNVSEQESLFAVFEADVESSTVDLVPIEPADQPGTKPEPEPEIEVRRSTRRRRTVSAHREGNRIIVAVPARMSRAEEQRWVAQLVARILASEKRARPTDGELVERAAALSKRYLGGRAVPASVRWVDNMASRWGSCTPVDATIRLSRRLDGMPAYVVDYVLLHELVHLLVPAHGPEFWRHLEGYERLERARGYLEGASAADSGPEPQL